MLEVMDLALHVLRAYARPLIQTMLLLVAPLMIVNQLLLGWLLEPVDFSASWTGEEFGRVTRYLINMSLLVFIEAPLATLLATAYLGRAVFLEQPRIRELLGEMRSLAAPIAWNHLLLRGVLPAWLLVLLIDRGSDYSGWEASLIVLAVCVAGLRAFRPFITEIVVLERLPLVRKSADTMTVGRRSALLHNPAGSDLLARWMGAALVGGLLTLGIYAVFLFASGIILNQWQLSPLLLQFCLPASMWIAALYLCVVRFLSYLDLRIRHEGWEVELRLRAEASRLASKLV
jgi:hypothetical protein